MPNFKVLNKEEIYRGKIVDLIVDHIHYDSGNTSIREIVEHPGGAVVLCVLENNDIVLIKQYRHPFGKEVVELPAGKLEKNEDPLHCAKRELQEETGFAARSWKKLASIMTTPGFCNEILHIFIATDVYGSEAGQALEEGETTLQVIRTSIDQAEKMIDSGEIVDAKTIIGILMGMRALKE